MNFLKSFYSKWSTIGVNRHAPHLRQKEIILSNQISLFLLPFALSGAALSYSEEIHLSFLGFAFFSLFLISVFTLNKYDKSILTRLGLSVLPQLFLLTSIYIIGIGKVENYLVFSCCFIGLTVIPLLLFQEKKDRKLLIVSLIFSLLAVLIFDLLLIWSHKSEFVIQLIVNNFLLYKISLIILWGLMVGTFLYMKKEQIHYRESLEATTNSLLAYKSEIQILKNEISSQSEFVIQNQITIDEKNKNLESSTSALENVKTELLKTAKKLEKVEGELGVGNINNILNVLDEHYLVARYDLSGNLVSINSKANILHGDGQNDFFKHIKPLINHTHDFHNETLDEQYFSHIWDQIINGKSHTVNLKFDLEDTTKYLATTFALLFNSKIKGYEILAIGQDISLIIERNGDMDKINKAQQEKLSEVSQQIDLLNFQQMDIFEKSELLMAQKEEIKTINESLELRVRERTQVLEKKNRQLSEYAFINSHVLRSPLSTMMGLINLIQYTSLSEEDQKIYVHLKDTSILLDDIVMKINNAIESGTHFDRHDLEPERNFHAINKD